jgi:hypothetical protein
MKNREKRAFSVWVLGIIALISMMGFMVVGCGDGNIGDTEDIDVPGGPDEGNPSKDGPGEGDGPHVSHFNFSEENGVITITGYYGSERNVTIPAQINGKPVTGIGDGAFSAYDILTSITIPDSVTSIGKDAFSNCDSLASITIPDSVTSIGVYAFSDCTNLTRVTMGKSVTSIGEHTFSGCTSLASITIPDSVTSIGDYAFGACASLASITIPDSVTSIGNHTFSHCTNLTSVTIPDSVTSIGWEAFTSCTNLTSVTIGKSVTSIGDHTFSYCTNLVSIVIPDSVTSFGRDVFANCASLASVTIGKSVTSIDTNTFTGCTGLSEINVDTANTAYSSGEGVLYTKDKTILLKCPSGKTGTLIIPNSVTRFWIYAFSGCAGLTSVTIPDDLIINRAIITDSDSNGDTFVNIAHDTFYGCTGLTEINVYDTNTRYSSINGVLYDNSRAVYENDLGIFLMKYPAGKTESSFTIPNNTTIIGDRAFSGCTGLTSVTIPNSVTSISEYAFSGCTGLTSVTIPESVTFVQIYAFDGCTNLTNVWIKGTETSLQDNVFVGHFPNGMSGVHYTTAPVNDNSIWKNRYATLLGTYYDGPSVSASSITFSNGGGAAYTWAASQRYSGTWTLRDYESVIYSDPERTMIFYFSADGDDNTIYYNSKKWTK